MMKIPKIFQDKNANDSSGFSLLEVLLGITVFMIGMLGVTALNISSLKSNTFSGNMSEAVIIAGDKLEELMAIDFEDDLLDAGYHPHDEVDNVTFAPPPDGKPDPLGKNGIYTLSWTVNDGVPLPDKTKTVNVTVEWDIKDVTRTMSMSTVILEHN